ISVVFLGAFSLSFRKLAFSDFGIQVLQFLYTTAYLSLYLALFNLVPIPPLDGSKVLFSFLPDEHYRKLMRYERYGMIVFAVIIFSGVITRPLSTAVDYVFGKLFDLIV
ncbi:MAG: site-2 protease family protein, partial [Oscillospiraceae bacterium]|nr:site-2 protease family protein [Oscillospiraceae bacterium]